MKESSFWSPCQCCRHLYLQTKRRTARVGEPVQGSRILLLCDWRCAKPLRFLDRWVRVLQPGAPANNRLQDCELLPLRHYSRKNLGYLLAIQTRPGLILETDDDNMPLPGSGLRESANNAFVQSGTMGGPTYTRTFSEANIWPRGLPLDAVQVALPDYDSLPEVVADCPINRDLPTKIPMWTPSTGCCFRSRLTFRKDRRLAFQAGYLVSVQQPEYGVGYPEAYPLLYLPSYCSIRMTDIWRSFIAQRIAWRTVGPSCSRSRTYIRSETSTTSCAILPMKSRDI